MQSNASLRETSNVSLTIFQNVEFLKKKMNEILKPKVVSNQIFSGFPFENVETKMVRFFPVVFLVKQTIQ